MGSFADVTELPGAPFPEHAFSMLYTRYHFAAQFCEGKDVLEIACGGGAGLGYLAKHARRVAGVDIDPDILRYPAEYYRDREDIEVRQADVQALPFADDSFDVVLIFEAIYYFSDLDRALAECRRVLREDGRLVLVSVNPEWPGFNPSPHSVRYYSAAELARTLERSGWKATVYGGYPDNPDTPKRKLIALLKRLAITFHLIPKTMKGKVLLKRIFFGQLRPYPSELAENMGQLEPLERIDPELPCSIFTNLYVAAAATRCA